MGLGVAAGELRDLDDDALVDRLKESKEELFNLRFQMATGQLTNNRRLRAVRREIARVKCLQGQRAAASAKALKA